MFIKDGILKSHEEILDALITYDYRGCTCSPKFLEVIEQCSAAGSEFGEAVLISAKLGEIFQSLETQTDGKYHRLFGHDVSGAKELLIERDY